MTAKHDEYIDIISLANILLLKNCPSADRAKKKKKNKYTRPIKKILDCSDTNLMNSTKKRFVIGNHRSYVVTDERSDIRLHK